LRACDTAIIGGGPAGSAAALALRKLGVEVVLIVAPVPAEKTQVGETLPPDARTILDELGLWEAFVRDGHEATPGSCSCWGSERLEYNDFVRNPKGNGWHLDRKRFDALLLREVKLRGVELLPARVTGFALEAEGAWLELTEAGGARQKIFARYTVDATGSGAAIARMTGARRRILDRLTFIYGFFEEADSVSRSQLTMLEAEEHGWWYLAPLPDSRVAVAFATDPEMVRKGGWTSESTWLASLLRTKRLAGRLEGSRYLRGELTTRSVTSSLLDPVAGPRWLAAGDAASVCDPLCSIGIYKALDTGTKAAQIIAAELTGGPPQGAKYADEICTDFEIYRANRNYLYGLETRWTESAFWRKRRERANWGEGTAF
jgi:flavin-dependent dehydrogenase